MKVASKSLMSSFSLLLNSLTTSKNVKSISRSYRLRPWNEQSPWICFFVRKQFMNFLNCSSIVVLVLPVKNKPSKRLLKTFVFKYGLLSADSPLITTRHNSNTFLVFLEASSLLFRIQPTKSSVFLHKRIQICPPPVSWTIFAFN